MLSPNAFDLRPRAPFRDAAGKLALGLAIGTAMGVASIAVGIFCRRYVDPGLAIAIAAAAFVTALLAWTFWRIATERTQPWPVLLAIGVGVFLVVFGAGAASEAGAAGVSLDARVREAALALALLCGGFACEAWADRRRRPARIFTPPRWTGRAVLRVVLLNAILVFGVALGTALFGR